MHAAQGNIRFIPAAPRVMGFDLEFKGTCKAPFCSILLEVEEWVVTKLKGGMDQAPVVHRMDGIIHGT